MIHSGMIDKGKNVQVTFAQNRPTTHQNSSRHPCAGPNATFAPGVEQEKNLAPEGRAEIVLPVKASWVPTTCQVGRIDSHNSAHPWR